MLQVIHRRGSVSVAAFGAAALYKSCLLDGELEPHARALARSILSGDDEELLRRAATEHIYPASIERNLARVTTIIRKLEPLAPALALLANGHKPCATNLSSLRPTLTRQTFRTAGSRT